MNILMLLAAIGIVLGAVCLLIAVGYVLAAASDGGQWALNLCAVAFWVFFVVTISACIIGVYQHLIS